MQNKSVTVPVSPVKQLFDLLGLRQYDWRGRAKTDKDRRECINDHSFMTEHFPCNILRAEALDFNTVIDDKGWNLFIRELKKCGRDEGIQAVAFTVNSKEKSYKFVVHKVKKAGYNYMLTGSNHGDYSVLTVCVPVNGRPRKL